MSISETAQTLGFLTNSLMYGSVKAEKQLTGECTVLSRIMGEEYGKVWFDELEKLGVKFETEVDPFDSIENFIDICDENGLASREDLMIHRESSLFEIKLCNCTFSSVCSSWIKEGYHNFGCIRMGGFLIAGKKSGKKLNCQNIPEPGNCKITIKLAE